MKKLNLKSVLFAAIAMSLSSLTFGQHDHNMMNMNHNGGNVTQQKEMAVMLNNANLNKAYRHYSMIKEALFKDDIKKVQMASKMLIGILKTYGKAPEASVIAANLSKAKNIEEQRKLFAALTVAFEPLIKDHVSKGTIYKNFCPMANGEGAYWFSNSEQIVNPYFSGNMTTCGSVKQTYKSM
ncbi:MAG: hypothetical protein COZ76_02985 [Flavobacteriales bacterium CG_4_8_14_3_um_filter_35_10]|nr:MAG: hypothetical protein COZ76_02985 [Flavobacteriales bacterium CG_4_8_14_3_um_filter_35_10]